MHEGKVWKKTRDDAEWELPPDETEMIQSTRTHGLPWGPLLGLYLRVKVTLSFSPGAIQRYGITNGRRKVPAVPRHFPKATCSVFSRLKKDKSIKSWDPTNLNALSGLNDSHVTGFQDWNLTFSKSERWYVQHIPSVGQKTSESATWSNPWPPRYRSGALTTAIKSE